MLAYAPRSTARSGSPRTLLLVAAGHVLAIALVLTAKSDFAQRIISNPPDVVFVPTVPPPPPPPPTAEPPAPSDSPRSIVDSPPVIIPTPIPNPQPLADGPPVTSSDPVIGNAIEPQPAIVPGPPRVMPVRRAARFATPADRIRPPYPPAKQQQEESASLRLTLLVDASGRVTAVTPVGATDPVFLAAARRHILRYWRYQPAMEGDAPVASNVTITLHFELEE